MGFFVLNPSLENAVYKTESHIEIRIEVEKKDSSFECIETDLIKYAYFNSYFDSESGVITRGLLTFYGKNKNIEDFKDSGITKVFFSCRNSAHYLHRFTLYADKRGFRKVSEGGKELLISVVLKDYPAHLKTEGAIRDWINPEMLHDVTFSDKENPEKSILHRILSQGNVSEYEIDTVTVPLFMPYVKLGKSPWDELCDLAYASLGIVEGGTDKKITFSSSVYQQGGIPEEDIPELDKELFYFIEKENAGDLFFNDIRLRWNKPERLSRQVLWKYDDPPVFYDEYLRPSYLFKQEGEKRLIEDENSIYYAEFTARNSSGEIKKAEYADELDSKEQVKADMECEGDGIAIAVYDVSAFPDRAIIRLECTSDTILKKISISGRAVVINNNQSCYRRDNDSINVHGVKVKNCTGKYFSDYEISGKPHYEDWTERVLERAKQEKVRFTVKSEYCLFHARTGAYAKLCNIDGFDYICLVEMVSFRYSEGKSFKVKMVLSQRGDEV